MVVRSVFADFGAGGGGGVRVVCVVQGLSVDGVEECLEWSATGKRESAHVERDGTTVVVVGAMVLRACVLKAQARSVAVSIFFKCIFFTKKNGAFMYILYI